MARFRIDVAGLPAGTDDEARNDGVSGSTVTITALDPATTRQLRIVNSTDLPAPTITSTGPDTWQFRVLPAGAHR